MEKLYKLVDEIREISSKCLIGQSPPKNEKEILLYFAIAKSDKTLMAVTLLCKNRFGEDAMILSRSLFELALTIKYIFSIKKGKFAQRFFDYRWVAINKLLKLNLENKNIKESSGEYKKVEKKAKEIQAKYEFNNNDWSDKNKFDMAVDCGWTKIYNTMYRLQCQIHHPNASSINDYFKETDNEFILDAGPSNNLVEESLAHSLHMVLYIVENYNDYFKKGFNDEIDKLASEILKVMKNK